MKKDLPIIHIIGLPGAGKTTLATKLAKRLGVPIYRIDEYRAKLPPNPIGEADAWVRLYYDLSKRKWRNCILETTGLNCREGFLRVALPPLRRITIKLIANKKVLYARLRQKVEDKQSINWAFNESYRNRFEFVKKLYNGVKKIHAEIEIDTNKIKPSEVFKKVWNELRFFLKYYSSERVA